MRMTGVEDICLLWIQAVRSQQASASMMTDAVMGKTKEEVEELAQVFSEMVQGQSDPRQEELGDAAFLSGVSKFPQRIKCATLSWNALKKAIERSK